MRPDEFMIVWSACPDRASADLLARHLVNQGLAACVTVLSGAVSTYRWRGKVEQADEVVLMIKTRSAAWVELEAAVQALHPYDTPELIAVPLAAGAETYLEWLKDSTE